jgi:hypothetical protein
VIQCEVCWNDTGKGNQNYWEKSVPVPLRPQEFLTLTDLGLNQDLLSENSNFVTHFVLLILTNVIFRVDLFKEIKEGHILLLPTFAHSPAHKYR